jgi:hypothetical protein
MDGGMKALKIIGLLLILLQILILILKAAGAIVWSWWLILLPLWAPVAFLLLLAVFAPLFVKEP